jgi:hypothetical protein
MGSLSIQVEAAQAQPGPNQAKPMVVVLEYSAPATCPNEAQFRERAERSSPRLRWAAPSENARAYRVLIDSTPQGFHAQLYDAGKATPRSLQAPVCEELVDALSLMLALSADAILAGAPAAAARIEADATFEADAMFENEAPHGAPVVEPPAPIRSAQPAPSALAKPPRRLTKSQRTAGPHLLTVSALALLNTAPDTLLGLAFSYERALQHLVSLRVETRGAIANDRAEETYGAVAPAVCLRLERSLGELVGCGGLTLGYLDVKGEEYSGAQSSYWIAPLLGLELRSSVAGLVIELGAELEHALIDRSYVLKRDDSSFQTPALSEVFQLGMGARF